MNFPYNKVGEVSLIRVLTYEHNERNTQYEEGDRIQCRLAVDEVNVDWVEILHI